MLLRRSCTQCKLLSTAPLAKHVSALGILLSESPPGGTVEARRKNLGFIGSGGVITVIESYVVEDGKNVRRVAAGGGEFDAYLSNFEK